MKRIIAILAAASTLASCAKTNFDPVQHYLSKRALSMPTKDIFQSCRGYGCQYIDELQLDKSEWKTIEKPFKRTAKTARQERKKIQQSIALFEQIVGKHTGTQEDVWGTFQKGGHYQQDCVDESTNTTIYLLALEQRGNIKFHTISTPQSRVPFMRWPHQSAVITEIESGDRYAVDSWFHNNGHPPEIIEFETWKSGWKPPKEQ